MNEQLDPADEMLADYFNGNLELEELELTELQQIIQRLQIMVAVKATEGFEEAIAGHIVHVPLITNVH